MTKSSGQNPQEHGDEPSYSGGVTDGNLAKPIGLRDFLLGVGTVLRLDKRAPKPKAQPQDAATNWRLPQLAIPRRLLVVLGGVSGFLLVAAGFVRQDASEALLPPTVFGEWVTNNPRYVNRSFWLDEKEVRFHLSSDGGDVSVHKIQHVHLRQAQDTTYFTIDYLEADKTVTWTVGYVSQPVPTIRFANQPELLWKLKGIRSATKH